MKKRLRKKWMLNVCSYESVCTKESYSACDTCKRYSVSQREKKAWYNFCKAIKHRKTAIWHKVSSSEEE